MRRLLIALAVLCAASAAVAAEPLAVCVAGDNPPQSSVRAGQARGLDVRIASAIAAELGRELRIVPFESEFEKESTLAQEVGALLSSGVCELAGGFPLLASDLGPPARASARTPDYPGAKRKRDRPFIPLRALAASRAYQGMALGVVFNGPAPAIARLAELRAPRIGAVSGSLSGMTLMMYRNGLLRSRLVSVAQRDDPLQLLRAGAFDAALLPTGLFDAHRLAHPDSPLTMAAYRRRIGINLGFVALAESRDTLAAADRVITRALSGGDMARWAETEGLSWLAPGSPEVSSGFDWPRLLDE
jgi:ABC-type amino acid transport substrate-binding protein